MAKERQKDEGAEMERGGKKKRRGRRKVKIESEPPGHKATKRKASLLFD